MAKKKKNATTLPQDVQEAAEKVFMAGVGALSVAEEEGSKLFKKLVKKGRKYDGEARKEVEQMRKQVEGQVTEARKQIEGQVGQAKKQVEGRVGQVKKSVDAQTGKVRHTVDSQLDRVKKAADETVSGFEHRVQEAVTVALQGLGIPTRDEIAALRQSVQQLSKNLDALKHERAIATESATPIEAVATGNGWYEVRVRGVVVDKVHGEEEAAEKVGRLLEEDAALTSAQREAGAEAVKGGGGWYTITLNGLAVDKVQGQEAAEARVAALEAQR
jgi:poly(hydroxyalkanoate) granule-associated protein